MSLQPSEFVSLVDVLEARMEHQSGDLAYLFLNEGKETGRLTFGELGSRARALAVTLRELEAEGERVLLLYPPGLDYVAAFLSALCAGAVAVPAYPPRENRHSTRLGAIVEDATPRVALVPPGDGAALRRQEALADLEVLEWSCESAAEGAAEAWQAPRVDGSALAFLQYTSGSTARPKGVMVSHGNLLHNQRLMTDVLGHSQHSVIVSWLPLYHDMGLIGNVLASLYNGCPCVILQPVEFLRRPVRWLEAITRYGGTFSGAPNFGYELCVERVTAEERESLDLRTWRAAFNGSEPVRAATLERFAEAFGSCGFRRQAFFPCYGLAEGTLFAAGRFLTEPPVAYSKRLLEHHQAVPARPDEAPDVVVSCGWSPLDGEVVIADPDDGSALPEGRVGEIWLRSGSVAQGYWGRPDETRETFGGRISPGGDGPYLRTGDLGFLHGGELHITGRIKDLIVLRGRNHYPQDIELTVDSSHPDLRPGFSAAFSVERDARERLVVVAEARRRARQSVDVAAVAESVRRAVGAEHAVEVSAVVVIRPGSLPRTSSGKIQRRQVRKELLAGSLAELGRWESWESELAPRPAEPAPAPPADAAALERWFLERLAARLKIDPRRIRLDEPVAVLGLDSLVAVDLVREVAAALGVQLAPESLFEGSPTVRELARRIARSRAEAADDGRDGGGDAVPGSPIPAVPDPPFRRHVNPELGRLLAQMKMDKTFVRGEGCYLYDQDGRRYLDFIAQYGALPFGFNPPRIWQALEEVRARSEPSFVQPSMLDAAGRLAERLVAAAPPGLQYVTYANSGAEAVEAAVKLCRSTTRRHAVLSTFHGFHGKTLGALSATPKPKYQKPFGAPVEGFSYVPYGDLEALGRALAARDVAAFLIEPIQGEGGIVEPPPGYLRKAYELCREAGTLFVLDEVQTGLGRTGSLFACGEEGFTPDVMLLAKALGGGLLPIGACLSTADAYNEDFALNHTSTFAGNALACRVALATLDWLQADDGLLVRQVAETGRFLKDGLLRLADRHLGLIAEVRGRGYMLGVRFGLHRGNGGDGILGYLGESDGLTALVVSHLLHFEAIRVGFTLNQGGILRVEPPLIATRADCQVFLDGFERALVRLESRDLGRFTGHLTGFAPAAWDGAPDAAGRRPAVAASPRRTAARPPARGESRFAFLVHPLALDDYTDLDPSLEPLSTEHRSRLAECLADSFDPFVVGEARVVSGTGATAYGEFVLLPRLAEELLRLPFREALDEVRKAAELASGRGAKIIGLGAFLSVVSGGGLYLKGNGLPALTTGNSYTVAATTTAVREGARQAGLDLRDATVAVVGATGAIGRAVSILLGPGVGRLLLLGNPRHPEASRRRLEAVAGEILERVWEVGGEGLLAEGVRRHGRGNGRGTARTARPGDGLIEIECDTDRVLPEADVVVTATSSVERLIRADHLKRGAVVCDVSRPSNVDPEVKAGRPDVLLIDGGVVQLPPESYFDLNLSLESGQAYACMAETMLLALERDFRDRSLGFDLDPGGILKLGELGRRHGFEAVVRAPVEVSHGVA